MKNNIETIEIQRSEAEKTRKELKKQGWLSAHYWTRRSVNVDRLRSLAKKGEFKAKILCNEGATTWYYHESEASKFPRWTDQEV